MYPDRASDTPVNPVICPTAVSNMELNIFYAQDSVVVFVPVLSSLSAQGQAVYPAHSNVIQHIHNYLHVVSYTIC